MLYFSQYNISILNYLTVIKMLFRQQIKVYKLYLKLSNLNIKRLTEKNHLTNINLTYSWTLLVYCAIACI